jgi:two-component system, NtrC family, response regulator GlrR
MTSQPSANPTRILRRPDDSVAVERRRIRLRVERGTSKGQELVSSNDRILVGSGAQADLVVDDASVSRLHLEIAADPRGYLLRDLGSTNGTHIGELRILESVLPERCRIVIGGTELSFTLLPDVDPVPVHGGASFGGLLGDSAVMRVLYAQIDRLAARNTSVLLEGESGTGKEVAARAIHDASPRRDQPFVVVDCGAIARTLLEAELFGHERGAYTGASQARAGAFALAQGGTLFLDEIGELDIELQPRLLGALERREIKPIGAAKPLTIDVRVIAATNRDLVREVNRGAFREDLFYRLAVIRVRMPSLREHLEDIPSLARHFLAEHARRDGVPYVVDQTTLDRLSSRPWPGNVRQLRNVIEQIVALGIEELEVPGATTPVSVARDVAASPRADGPEPRFGEAKAAVVTDFERAFLRDALARHNGNISAVARAAEIDRVHLLRLLDKHGLRKPKA